MKTIELLLLDNIENLGIVGDVVKVKPGYARNYLLPRGLAEAPTEEKIQALAERRAQAEAEMKALREAQEAMIGKLTDYELTLERSANEQGALFGGVSQHDIAVALQEAGFEVEDQHVRLGEKINRLDTYHIPIQIARELKTEIKLWVVSDKPLEQEDDAEADEEQAEGQQEATAVDAVEGTEA
ncbi:MAG: 50S ribosomal protein L9 [Planctomycetota bacterium]